MEYPESGERGGRIASPAYPLAPKASGLFGMGIAHEGELARGGSGPEKRLGRETRRRKGGAR